MTDELQHYGVKGMKWGVRKDKSPRPVTVTKRPGKKVKTKGGQYHPPSKDAIRSARIQQRAKVSTTDSLSNKELREAIDRMNLEQQYKRMAKKTAKQAAVSWVASLLKSEGDRYAKEIARDAIAQEVKRAMKS